MNAGLIHSCHSRCAFGVVLLILSAGPLPVSAAEPVGRVISVAGEVTAVRVGESARSLDRGGFVYPGDEIHTGVGGSTQIRFDDGGLVALQTNTRFAVDRYQVGDDGDGGSALLRLFRGALRTVTGTIDGAEGGEYRLKTPPATIGLRGTEYQLHYCDADCARQDRGEQGLYGRVDEGRVWVSTAQGENDFGAGGYFFAAPDLLPHPILRPPPGVLGGGAEDGAPAVASAAADAVPGIGPPGPGDGDRPGRGPPGPVFQGADLTQTPGRPGMGGPPGLARGGVSVAAAGNTTSMYQAAALFGQGNPPFTTDAQGRVTGVDFGPAGPMVANDNVTLEDAGSLAALGVKWGRWNGTFVVDGQSGDGNLGFVSIDRFTPTSALAGMQGTLDYDLAGGPQAFDAAGNLWSVDALSLAVDFKMNQVGLNTFELSGMGDLSFSSGDTKNESLNIGKNQLSLDLDGASGAGTIDGKFVGANAEGAVVGFTVNSKAGDFISGTKVLEQKP